MCDPDSGFILDGQYEQLLWHKWAYWRNGIPAKQFWKERMNDIKDIMFIESAIAEKNLSQKRINKLIGTVGH